MHCSMMHEMQLTKVAPGIQVFDFIMKVWKMMLK